MMLSTTLTLGNAKSLWAAGNVQKRCGMVEVSPSVQRYYKGSGNGIDCGRGTHDPDEENLVCVTNTCSQYVCKEIFDRGTFAKGMRRPQVHITN